MTSRFRPCHWTEHCHSVDTPIVMSNQLSTVKEPELSTARLVCQHLTPQRWLSQGTGVDVFAVQPGLTSTSLYSGMQKSALFYWFFVAMTFFLGQSPERGSLSLLYCATEPKLTGKLCCIQHCWSVSHPHLSADHTLLH